MKILALTHMVCAGAGLTLCVIHRNWPALAATISSIGWAAVVLFEEPR